jgi:hypothetical protein
VTGGDGATTGAASCMACGRELRDEESKQLRLGPVCRKRLQRALAPRPRRISTPIADPHPQAVPARRTIQLALELWDDEDDDEAGPFGRPAITDVPTGALL